MAERDPHELAPHENGWLVKIEENPGHSQWYIDRFREKAEQGEDLGGEARLIDAMADRGSRILDAGCGPGRVGGRLHAAGHTVVGVDLDPKLIEAAEADYPGPTWLTGDLATLDLSVRGIAEGFDMIVSAGNVMAFVAVTERVPALRQLGKHLNDNGRIVVGFGNHRGYSFDEFDADATTAGLVFDAKFATWDLRPFGPDADFIVAVMRNA